MERRNECIEMLKEIKNSLEEVVNINATFIGGISCDSAKFVIDQAILILENENPSKMYKTLIDASYERGLNLAWECAKKIAADMTIENLKSCGLICTNDGEYEPEEYEYSCEVINKYSASEAIAKIKEYEERKKKDEEIKVGDEVVYLDRVFVITSIVKNEYIMGFDSNGERCSYHYKTKLKKTGRTFPQIIEVLEKIKEKQNEQI